MYYSYDLKKKNVFKRIFNIHYNTTHYLVLIKTFCYLIIALIDYSSIYLMMIQKIFKDDRS